MLNREKHQLIMGQILKEIFTDVTISSRLGLKGGTCAYFFYGLPRFSVDLDFDLLEISGEIEKEIFQKVIGILGGYGQIKDKYIKRFTIFALLSYGNDDHNIKVEINIRGSIKNTRGYYVIREHLGISMLVAKRDYLFAGKLAALTTRKEVAMRDIYDIHYFAKNNWDINWNLIGEITGKSPREYLAFCIAFLEKVKNNHILQGLGELVDGEKEKNWIKNNLKADTIFMLKNYLSVSKNP